MGRTVLFGARTALLASLLGSVSGVAMAQSAGAENAEVADSDTIIVTAERRSERLIDVPASLSVVTSEDIQDRTLISLSDLSTRTPNVLISGSSLFPNVTIRGVGSPSGLSPGFAPAAVVYVDEVYQGRDRAMNLPLTGIQQVEVLRGPQGTLYGKNTIAGAMNITTLRPGDTFEAFGSVMYGNLDYTQLTGTISGPVIPDTLSVSLSGLYRDRDGYIHNAFDNSELNYNEARGGRVRAIYTATPNLTFDFSADYLDERGTESLLTTDYSTIALLPFPPYNTTPTFDPRTRTVSLNSPESAHREVHGYSARFDYDFSGVRLTSISASRGYEANFQFDSDGTSLRAVRQSVTDDLDQFSQELRLTSTHEGPFQWIAGAFYYQEEQRSVRQSDFLEDFPGFLLGLPPFPPGYVDSGVADSRIRETSTALFLSGSYELTPRLTLAAGARYTFDRKRLDFSQLETTPVTPSIITALLSTVPPRVERQSNSEPTFDISLSYAFTYDQVGYVRFSRGYKGGGFNAVLITPPFDPADPLGFDPEFLNNYEAGFKVRWLDRRLSLNSAVFYNEYTDKQEQVQNLTTLGFVVRNAAEARIYGAEFEVEARPIEGLSLTGTLGLLDGTYTSFPNAAAGGLDFTDNQLARAPRWQGTFAAQYDRELPGLIGVNGMGRVEVVHSDSSYLDPNNTPSFETEAATFVNARLGLETDHWGVHLWGKNLTDEFLLSGGSELVVTRARGVNMPRTYGIELTFRN